MDVVSISIETIIKTFHEVGSINKTARLLKKQERYIARRLDQAGIARKRMCPASLCMSCSKGYAHLCIYIAAIPGVSDDPKETLEKLGAKYTETKKESYSRIMYIVLDCPHYKKEKLPKSNTDRVCYKHP